MSMNDLLERPMAQTKHDLAAQTGKPVPNCMLDEDDRNDSVTPEGMALVRDRALTVLSGRTFRSIIEPSRVVRIG